MCYFAPDFSSVLENFKIAKIIINILKYYNYVRN